MTKAKAGIYNLPNLLSLIRILPVIPFTIGIFMDNTGAKVVAIICFAVASLTDFVDGRLARKYDMVTKLGKFLDPLADKMLVNLAFLSLVALGQVPVWVFAVILVRDFMVDGLRMIAASNGVTIAASKIGKIKTLTQMVTLIMVMINMITENPILANINSVMLVVVVIITVASGLDYLIKGRKLMI